jgi:hypothetical protein
MNAHTSPPRGGCHHYIFALCTCAFALVQAGAAYRAVTTPAEVVAVVALPLGLEFVLSGIWALLFGYATFVLIRQTVRAAYRAIVLICVFILYSVARLVLFVRADYDRQRLPFLLILAILTLIFLVVVYVRQRDGERNFSDGNKRET